jgi:hypothetical protein
MRSRPRKGISLRACRLPGFEQVIGGPPCVSVMIVRRARGVRSTKEGKQQRGSNGSWKSGSIQGESTTDMLGYCNRVEVIVVAQIDNRSSAEFSPLRVVVRRRALSCLSRLAFALQGCKVDNPYLPYLTFMYLCIGVYGVQQIPTGPDSLSHVVLKPESQVRSGPGLFSFPH